jgi:hypothetical protein
MADDLLPADPDRSDPDQAGQIDRGIREHRQIFGDIAAALLNGVFGLFQSGSGLILFRNQLPSFQVQRRQVLFEASEPHAFPMQGGFVVGKSGHQASAGK